MNTLRVIGDVHGQIEPDDLLKRGGRCYLDLIAGAHCSVQIGDLGDAVAYSQLIAAVDPARHRFFGGNHDHHPHLPPHHLGDFGAVSLGGTGFFFIRGAESTDRDKLLERGRALGKQLWFPEEELTDEAMAAAAKAYLQAKPTIMLTHDAPTEIARFTWQYVSSLSTPQPGAAFRPSRTNRFLTRLWEQHAPRLWLFGHHHRDWQYREGATLFVCVGELSYVDINSAGDLVEP